MTESNFFFELDFKQPNEAGRFTEVTAIPRGGCPPFQYQYCMVTGGKRKGNNRKIVSISKSYCQPEGFPDEFFFTATDACGNITRNWPINLTEFGETSNTDNWEQIEIDSDSGWRATPSEKGMSTLIFNVPLEDVNSNFNTVTTSNISLQQNIRIPDNPNVSCITDGSNNSLCVKWQLFNNDNVEVYNSDLIFSNVSQKVQFDPPIMFNRVMVTYTLTIETPVFSNIFFEMGSLIFDTTLF